MSRMIPAKVRAEGSALCQDRQVVDVEMDHLMLTCTVAGQPVHYDLDGEADSCLCVVFQKNGRYCPHIAAVEVYLKQEGRKKLGDEIDKALEVQAKSRQFQETSLFLKGVNSELVTFSQAVREPYRLEVEIQDKFASDESLVGADSLILSFHIQFEQGKSYIVRDIPALLYAIEQETAYTLGKRYIPKMGLLSFDEISRKMIESLNKLLLDEKISGKNSFYRKAGRFVVLPFSQVFSWLSLLGELSNLTVLLDGTSGHYFSFSPLDEESELYQFEVTPKENDIQLNVQKQPLMSYYQGRLVYFEDAFYAVSGQQNQLIKKIDRETFPLSFAYSEKSQLAQALQEFSKLGRVNAPSAFQIQAFTPKVAIQSSPKKIRLRLVFDYGEFEIDSFSGLETLEISRDLRLEGQLFTLLASIGFKKAFRTERPALTTDEIYDFHERFLPALKKIAEVSLAGELAAQAIATPPQISVSSRGNLLDVSFELPEVSEKDLSAVMESLKEGQTHYVTGKGQLVKFDKAYQPLRQLLTEENTLVDGHHLSLSNTQAYRLFHIFDGLDAVKFDKKYKEFSHDLRHPKEFPYQNPKGLQANLRPYQEEGVRWMNMLSSYGLGGILADDMGLGKTVQAISFLLSNLTGEKKALILAPSSLVYNWEEEFKKFSKGLDVAVIEGTKEGRSEKIKTQHQIYVTSYGSFLKDLSLYREMTIDHLMLDEAQMVKNFQSKTNKALLSLKVGNSFALSGTPVENKLDELWAIMELVIPGLLPGRKQTNKMKNEELLRRIHPFILRRKKDQVLKELPERFESELMSELSQEQKVVYLAQLEQMRTRFSGMDAQEFSKSRIEILAGITRLRQICDTPALFLPAYQGSSGKLDSLRLLLEQAKAAGRRPLIFSQFTSLFPIIEKLLEELGMSAYKITGSTPAKARLEEVQAFNAGSRDVFLISLKAGGVGLNLTASDLVVLVDLWWNPSVEEQAISRAHRMGQKKLVEVVRLITQGTIEEKILEIQSRKKNLFTAILDSQKETRVLDQREINEILGIET